MKIRSVITDKYENLRLHEQSDAEYSISENSAAGTVAVSTKDRYQTFTGFGVAFTEAGSTSLDKLPETMKQEAIDAYFHPEKGINYNFCRTHINSCDFSIENYTYVEDEDTELKTFSIERDRKSLIPLIKKAMETKKRPLTIFASPWSPPAWMKTNGRMNTGGSLKREYYQIWADYFVKYLKAYKAEGIDIWGVSIQNEPQAVTPWDNCIYSSEEERDFVKVLGKTFEQHGLQDKKIIVWDHNKDVMKERVDVILGDSEAAQFVWGVGFHWYSHNDEKDNMDDTPLDHAHDTYGTNLVFTEGCTVLRKGQSLLGKWWTGEKYGMNIINDLNHWTTAWCDWNLYLDERGGPNHANNFCDAPIIADTVNKKLHYNSPYYYIAHFSKYILPGAVRLGITVKNEKLKSTAFMNTDDSIAVVVMNNSEEKIGFSVSIDDKSFYAENPARSIKTFIINR